MDIAIALNAEGDLSADWSCAAGDLAKDDGLRAAVLVSLFTDRTAAADDEIPDGSGDRRGWWGDLPRDGAELDPIGSRLWLLQRAKRTTETLERARTYAGEALAWLVADGLAAAVDVEASWAGDLGDQLRLVVTIRRGGQPDQRFDLLWSNT